MPRLLGRKTLSSKNWYKKFSASSNIEEKLREILKILLGNFHVAIFKEPQDQENSHIFAIVEKFSPNRNN